LILTPNSRRTLSIVLSVTLPAFWSAPTVKPGVDDHILAGCPAWQPVPGFSAILPRSGSLGIPLSIVSRLRLLHILDERRPLSCFFAFTS
jgi:hypothetical protein